MDAGKYDEENDDVPDGTSQVNYENNLQVILYISRFQLADDEEEYSRVCGEHSVLPLSVHDPAFDGIMRNSALHDAYGGESD